MNITEQAAGYTNVVFSGWSIRYRPYCEVLGSEVCWEEDKGKLKRFEELEVGMNWYLVRSKPRQESIAELNLHRYGVETFCPQWKQTKLFRGKKQSVIIPLFPGYLFSKFNLDTDYRKVAYTHGVLDVVKFGTTPARVDEEIVEAIRAKTHEGFVQLLPPTFVPGETVQIQDGPLKGLLAVFERELTGSQRVALLLKNVSYNARLVIEREWVSHPVGQA